MFQVESLTLLLTKFRWYIASGLVGLILLGLGFLATKNTLLGSSEIQVLTPFPSSQSGELVVEIAGAVIRPGVYKLPMGARIDDLLTQAGGLSDDANSEVIAKSLNRAAKLTDGQKLYIPSQSEVLSASSVTTGSTISNSTTGVSSKTVNINTASTSQLDSLNGIGPVYAQKIIDGRPYSSVEELVSRKIIPQNTYEKIKDGISAF